MNTGQIAFQLILIFLGLNTIVGGIAIMRLRKLSPSDVKDKPVRPAFTGMSAILIAIMLIVSGFLITWAGFYPEHPVTGTICNGVLIFMAIITILSGILEGIRQQIK